MRILKLKNHILTFILLILILTSMTQILFIWGDDLSGFPFSLFYTADKRTGESLSIGNLFIPAAIYIGRGIEQPRYKLEGGSLDTVWNDTRRFLSQVFENHRIISFSNTVYSAAEWQRAALKRGFYITFPFDAEPELLRCLLNCSTEFNLIQGGIRAVAILPWDNINPNMLNIYIRSSNIIYRFTIEVDDLTERRFIYDIFQEEYERGVGTEYYYLSEIFPPDSFGFEINETLPITNDENERIAINAAGVLNSLEISNTIDDEGYVNEVAAKISNNKETNYISSKNSENTVVLKNVNNIYRYYQEGVIEYNLISSVSRPEDNLPLMINNVVKQLNTLSYLINIEDLFLSGFRKEGMTYIFTFDYMFNQRQVMTKIPYSGGNAESLIEIVSDGLNVTAYTLIPVVISERTETTLLRIDFVGLLDKLYLFAANEEGFSFKEYRSVYLITDTADDKPLFPIWCVTSFQNTRYYVEVAER